MFDFSGSELLVLAVVALVLIGPKDMPVAVRGIARVLKKVRRMAGEFQGHVDEMMREADLSDVQSTLRDLRGMNVKGALNRFVDSDGTLARAFDDPFVQHEVPAVTPTVTATTLPEVKPTPPAGGAPSFIPPAAAHIRPVVPAPSFVPPAAAAVEPRADDY
jgi:sec-independent protein translocase protein TatB